MTFWAVTFRGRQYLKGSLWVVPLFGALFGPVLAYAAWRADQFWTLPESMRYSAETASGLLTAIVAAMIGLLGFVVTVGVLVVQMATGTLSPRFMRLWYRDRLQKLVLAGFVGTFTYSFSLLSRIEEDRVPDVGVQLAGILTVTNLVLLLLYLDRFTHNLRPVAVAASVGAAGREVIRRMSPGPDGRAGAPAATIAYEEPPLAVIRSRGSGVIQAINIRRLDADARRHGCLLVLAYGIGDFVPRDSALIRVYGGGRAPSARRLCGWVALGRERTIDQDPAFALRVLADIAIRALSPAVNDPTTAIQVLDHVEELLHTLARTPAAVSATDGRVIAPQPGWDAYVALALTEIRQYGAGSAQVARRLHALLDDLAEQVAPAQRPPVLLQAHLLDLALREAWKDPESLTFSQIADRQGIGGGNRTGPPARELIPDR